MCPTALLDREAYGMQRDPRHADDVQRHGPHPDGPPVTAEEVSYDDFEALLGVDIARREIVRQVKHLFGRPIKITGAE